MTKSLGTQRFAALDSDLASATLERHLSVQTIDSTVFVNNPGQSGERVYARSAAALRELAVDLGLRSAPDLRKRDLTGFVSH